MSGMVSVFNHIIKVLVVSIVKSLRLKTVSVESKIIMNFVFFISFFNTGIMLYIVNINYFESDIPMLRQVLSLGKNSDFSQQWYTVMGPILVYTILMNAIVPVLSTIKTMALWYFKQAYDRGFT